MALYLETVATANSYEYPDGWRHWVIAMARALKSLPFIGYMARTMLILDGRLGRWEYVKRGGGLRPYQHFLWPGGQCYCIPLQLHQRGCWCYCGQHTAVCPGYSFLHSHLPADEGTPA